jgi:hypothetical protein
MHHFPPSSSALSVNFLKQNLMCESNHFLRPPILQIIKGIIRSSAGAGAGAMLNRGRNVVAVQEHDDL